MHNAAYDALSLNYCYVPFPVSPDDLEVAIHAARALHIRGLNITIPHKEMVVRYLDEIDAGAIFIGAVNTVVNSEGRLTGHNTDGNGFMQSLVESGIDVKDKKVLLIGAGGAARAVGYSLIQTVKSVSLLGRTKERVQKLVNDLNRLESKADLYEEVTGLEGYHMIINATPLGLKDDDPLPMDVSLLRTGQVVYDLVYRKTRFLQEASGRGCIAVDGLGMLLWQGVLAFELWTGIHPDVSVMRTALQRAVNAVG